jgi:hypothetical protein
VGGDGGGGEVAMDEEGGAIDSDLGGAACAVPRLGFIEGGGGGFESGGAGGGRRRQRGSVFDGVVLLPWRD